MVLIIAEGTAHFRGTFAIESAFNGRSVGRAIIHISLSLKGIAIYVAGEFDFSRILGIFAFFAGGGAFLPCGKGKVAFQLFIGKININVAAAFDDVAAAGQIGITLVFNGVAGIEYGVVDIGYCATIKSDAVVFRVVCAVAFVEIAKGLCAVFLRVADGETAEAVLSQTFFGNGTTIAAFAAQFCGVDGVGCTVYQFDIQYGRVAHALLDFEVIRYPPIHLALIEGFGHRAASTCFGGAIGNFAGCVGARIGAGIRSRVGAGVGVVATIICRRGNGTAITAIGRRWGYSAVVALWGCRLGGVVRLRGLWLFVLLRCGFVVVAAVVALRGGRNGFGDDRCLRVGRAVIAAAATAGGQRGKDCAGKEQFCGFHVVYLEVYW